MSVNFRSGGVVLNQNRTAIVRMGLNGCKARTRDNILMLYGICRNIFQENHSVGILKQSYQFIIDRIGITNYEDFIDSFSRANYRDYRSRFTLAERAIPRIGSLKKVIQFVQDNNNFYDLPLNERAYLVESSFPLIAGGWWLGPIRGYPKLPYDQLEEVEEIDLREMAGSGGGIALINCCHFSALYVLEVEADGNITLWQHNAKMNFKSDLLQRETQVRDDDIASERFSSIKLRFGPFGVKLKTSAAGENKSIEFPYYNEWLIGSEFSAQPPVGIDGYFERWCDAIRSIKILKQ
ncbi:hypothetical protein ACFL52_01650 [Candidatus Margulisiibacteriota bacterium]